MKPRKNKPVREGELLGQMIALYCKKQHRPAKGVLCPDCAALLDYARQRSRRCPFGENKTFCSNCKVHCYKPDMRENIRAVMRFSGPRMLLRRPLPVLAHMRETLKERRKLK